MKRQNQPVTSKESNVTQDQTLIHKDVQISVEQFKSMSATNPNVNSLFQRLLSKLENPRATAIEMRRLGHFIEYEE